MNKQSIAIGAAILFVVAGAIALYFFVVRGPVAPTPLTPVTTEAPRTLGEAIYAEAQNPIAGELSETNPLDAANPIEEMYKNPFE